MSASGGGVCWKPQLQSGSASVSALYPTLALSMGHGEAGGGRAEGEAPAFPFPVPLAGFRCHPVPEVSP